MNGKFLDGPRTTRQDWLFLQHKIFIITKVKRSAKSSQDATSNQNAEARDSQTIST
jgi:hypothetical protein